MANHDDISKSQRKRDMHALQDLGKSLVELPADKLARVDLPESLADAIDAARRITQRGALRRQLQYVGKLMRGVDVEYLQTQLDLIISGGAAEIAIQHQAEHWRERLLTDDQAIEMFARDNPQCDVGEIRTLIRNSKREVAAAKPPRSSRQLFRTIRYSLERSAAEKHRVPFAEELVTQSPQPSAREES